MKPKVSLINWTPKSIETMCWTRRVMHSPVPSSLAEFEEDPEKWLGMPLDQYVDEVLLKDGMPTFLEFVHLTFLFENVSRALSHQLVRHRIGFTYSQQSLRCVKLPTFAADKHYHLPNSVKDKNLYENAMWSVQELYNDLLEAGVSTQDARGILPMNIGTTIIVGCTLRALIGMVNKRLCLKTQEEFRSVAEQVVEEIKLKVDPRLLKWIGKPCDSGKCMMRSENEQQYKEGKLIGKQNTDHCCPIYVKKFAKVKNGNKSRS